MPAVVVPFRSTLNVEVPVNETLVPTFSVPTPLVAAGSPGATVPPLAAIDWEIVPVPPSVPLLMTETLPVPVPEPLVLLTSRVPPETVVLMVVPGLDGP